MRGERMIARSDARGGSRRSDGKVFLAQMSSLEAYATTETFGRWNADETRARVGRVRGGGCNRFDAVLREALRANPKGF